MSDTYLKFRNEVMAGGASDQPGEERTAGGLKAWVALAVIVGLLVALAMWNIWAFVFVVGLLVCIFLHELGHFLTARASGMKVTQFFLFMGPKLSASAAARRSTASACSRSARSCASSG